jgi:hypothetical protein
LKIGKWIEGAEDMANSITFIIRMERDGKRCKGEDQAKTEEENAHGLIQKLMADVMVDTGK